jgi:hypothetical protein
MLVSSSNLARPAPRARGAQRLCALLLFALSAAGSVACHYDWTGKLSNPLQGGEGGGGQSGAAGTAGGGGDARAAGTGGVGTPLNAGGGAGSAGRAVAGIGAAGTAGSGGMTAGVGAETGGAGSGGTPSSPEPCTSEAALRCASRGAGQRERCESGVWVSAAACAQAEVCSSAAGAACKPASAICQGNAGKPVCDENAGLYLCAADGSLESQEMCMSPAHCQKGLAARRCATCIPDTHRCVGPALQVCATDGQSYQASTTCDTAALCNAEAGACTTATCTPNKFTCQGDVLKQCNADGTAFNTIKPCDKGLCDGVAGECDVCTPGQKSCETGTNVARTCAANGQSYETLSCSGQKPKCVGTGQCVECASDVPCPASTQTCKINACNLLFNTCSLSNDRSGAACTTTAGAPGACDGAGACVECLTEGDGRCGGGTPHCNSAHKCVACTSNSHCNPVSEKCALGVCKLKCGDGVIDEGEDCERGLQGWDSNNCNFSTCKRNVYESCYQHSEVCDMQAYCLAGYYCIALSDNNCVTSCPQMPGYTSRCASAICYLACDAATNTGCPADMHCVTGSPDSKVTVDMCFGRTDL